MSSEETAKNCSGGAFEHFFAVTSENTDVYEKII